MYIQNPKSLAGYHLKQITSKLHAIDTHYQLSFWLLDLHNWYKEYQNFINEKSYNKETERYWFTHKMVRRSFMTIKRALPNMFHYLDNPRIPKSSNSIEQLIYDFSISQGDSLTVMSIVSSRTIYLDSIRPYILENGDTTRIFHFTDPPCTLWNPTYFVEGIGGVAGLMFPIDICFEGDATLSCVSNNNILLYKNTYTYYTCGIGTGINEIKEENKFQPFPNPATNEINFHNLIYKPVEIKILDITSKIVSIQGFSEKINISLLKSGIYFVKLIYKDKIETIKFIKK